MMPYDLMREEVIALSGVLIQVVTLAGFLFEASHRPFALSGQLM